MGNNRVFWAFMNFVITFCWKLFKIKDLNNSLFSSAISISGKILHKLLTEILSSNQIRLQDSLIINISARNESISFDFLNKDIVQGKVAFETTILCWMCPDMPSQAQTWLDLLWVPLVGLGVRPTSNNLEWRITNFLVKQCFFHNLIHTVSKYSLKDVPDESECRILWSSISLEGNNQYLELFCKEITANEK